MIQCNPNYNKIKSETIDRTRVTSVVSLAREKATNHKPFPQEISKAVVIRVDIAFLSFSKRRPLDDHSLHVVSPHDPSKRLSICLKLGILPITRFLMG